MAQWIIVKNTIEDCIITVCHYNSIIEHLDDTKIQDNETMKHCDVTIQQPDGTMEYSDITMEHYDSKIGPL